MNETQLASALARPLRVRTFNQISTRGLARFPEANYAVGPELADPVAILLRSHKLDATSVGTNVLAVGRAGAGVNNIPVKDMSRRGIPVFNAPGANANAVKELVLAALLMAARNLVPALRYVEGLAGESTEFEPRVEAGKKQFAGFELPGRTLGIVGLGAIGRLVAEAALGLGMQVLGYDPEITVDAAWRLPAGVRKAETLDAVLRQSEMITLHLPLIDTTRRLIGESALAQVRPGTVLLNFARDAIVDERAVLAALGTGRLRYYFCDFPSPALAGAAGAIAWPHLGASTEEAEDQCAIMVADQLRGFLERGTIRNAVNFPDVDLAPGSPHRLAIAHANVPNMLAQISTTLGQSGLNILDLVNKSRGELAYTLLDVDRVVAADTLRSIAAIDGVIATRFIPLVA